MGFGGGRVRFAGAVLLCLLKTLLMSALISLALAVPLSGAGPASEGAPEGSLGGRGLGGEVVKARLPAGGGWKALGRGRDACWWGLRRDWVGKERAEGCRKRHWVAFRVFIVVGCSCRGGK